MHIPSAWRTGQSTRQPGSQSASQKQARLGQLFCNRPASLLFSLRSSPTDSRKDHSQQVAYFCLWHWRQPAVALTRCAPFPTLTTEKNAQPTMRDNRRTRSIIAARGEAARTSWRHLSSLDRRKPWPADRRLRQTPSVTTQIGAFTFSLAHPVPSFIRFMQTMIDWYAG